LADQVDVLAHVTGFLLEFACSGNERILTWLKQATWGFEAVSLRAGAELADEYHLILRGDGHDVDRVGKMHDVIVMRDSGEPRPKSFAAECEQPVRFEGLVGVRLGQP
jgi:hypothetical protein